MLSIAVRAGLLTALLATSACTQSQVAHIEMKGQNSYGRNGTTQSYASTAPVYSNTSEPVYSETTQSAGIQAIDVRELAPAAGTPQARPTVNPWTNTPRYEEKDDQSFNLRPQSQTPAKEQMVSEVKLSPAPVTQLERVINEEDAPPLKIKPVAKATSGGFIWPVTSKKIISGFGPKGGGKVNDGINIGSVEGEPIWAAADGEIIYADSELAGYGNMIIIKHSGDKTTTYAHLSRSTVDKYDRVKQGDIIGYVGSTGNIHEPQLHFALRDGKEPVDPKKYLGRKLAQVQ